MATTFGRTSSRYAINDAGQVAGSASIHRRTSLLPRLPLHRHARQRRRDGTTWAPSAGRTATAAAINDAGQVAGSATIAGDARAPRLPLQRHARQRRRRWRDLGTLGGTDSVGYASTTRGQVAG